MLRSPRSERTRQSVLSAAEAAFTEHGFEGATSQAIARQAGVSEGTVFGHFGSKAGLLLAVMERYYADAFAELDLLTEEAVEPEPRLRLLVRAWLVRVVSDWSLVRVFSQHGRFSGDASVRDTYRELSRGLMRRFLAALSELRAAGRIRADLPLSLLRDVLFGAGEHVALRWSGPVDRAQLVRIADQLVDVLLFGAGPAAAAGEVTLATLDAKLDRLLAGTGDPE